MRVFVSYRRDDLHGHAPGLVGRIFDRLAQHYGAGNVFMDIDTIPPGADFVEYLGGWVGKADVLLAVMGPQWAELLAARAGQEDDFVRIEIEAALERRIPVVPLFLGGAGMPGPAVLTGNLAALRRRNGYPVDSGRDFNAHVGRLIAALEEHYGEGAGAGAGPAAPPAPPLPTPVQDFAAGLGMRFVPVQPGTFLMGSPGNEEGRFEDEVLHEVTLTRGFEMADAPVTQGQWEAVMGNNPSHFKRSGAEAPVEQVSWEEAVKWCAKMGEKHPGWDYRLPTEAEWEYACRAGTSGPWNVAGAKLEDLGWYEKNSGSKTRPVRQKRSNAWGLYDCHGNVWEWCADWFGEYAKGAVPDPTGPQSGVFRVLRGGSWDFEARDCRSANRDGPGNDFRDYFIGFRPVRRKKIA